MKTVNPPPPQKNPPKQKNPTKTFIVTHFKKTFARVFCAGVLKSIQNIITLDMKQWIYDKTFKIYDKDKINLPSEYKRNNEKPNKRI